MRNINIVILFIAECITPTKRRSSAASSCLAHNWRLQCLLRLRILRTPGHTLRRQRPSLLQRHSHRGFRGLHLWRRQVPVQGTTYNPNLCHVELIRTYSLHFKLFAPIGWYKLNKVGTLNPSPSYFEQVIQNHSY